MSAIYCGWGISVLGFRRGSSDPIEAHPLQHFARLSPSRHLGRLAEATGLKLKKHGVLKISASGSNPPDSNTSRERKCSSSSSGSDPPLLTILAGLVIFLLVLVALASIFLWLLGLILHPPSR
ncbi:uncharacterized protein LOC110035745 [Phalaenopsis equestris]|uniref:uncharacterized protein LOC110035745 n=1 Tax=Phalaenopsis equestris TaxID=78828 RepID=UPI0009E51AF9|nr:uncharacterized protein LOC110035745 [Phalaenopsis equestris]